jgi:general stress protein 26
MNKKQLLETSRRLMQTSASVYLTTVSGHGIPFTRAMLNVRNRKQYPSLVKFFAAQKGELVAYFTTNTSSDKVKHVKKHPYVSVYYCDPKKFHGLMLGGRIQIVKDAKIKKALWQKGWEKYYPGGFDSPDHTVFKLVPSVARGWYKFAPFTLALNKKR